MSSIEIARLTLGVFPLVLSALKYHNAAFGATKQQQSMPMQFQTECKNFRTTCARVLWLVFRNDDGLSAALNDPGDKMWQEPSLESDLIDVLGSAHPLFLELCQQMMSTVGCTKTELDKITDSKSSFSKRLRYSLKSGFIKSELCKIHLINESLRNLVRNAPNQRQLYQFKCDYRRGTYSRQSFDDFKSTKNDVYKLRYIFSALANKTRAPFKGTVFMDCVAFGGRQSGYTFLWDVNAVSVNPDDDSKSCWYEINVKVSASNGEQFIRGTPDGQAKDSKRSSIAPATKTRARFATSALSIADPELPRTKNLRSPFFYHPNPPSREVRHFEDVQKFVECLSRLRHSALPRETLHLTDSYANSTVTADYLRLNSSCRVTLQDLIKTKQRISTRAKYTLAITLTRAILTIYTSGLLCKRLDSKTVLFLVESGKIRVENALLQIKDRSTHGTGIASLYLMGLAENYPIPAVDLGVLLLQIFLPCEKALELAELAESLSFSEQKAKALRTLQSSHVDLTYNCANVISSCLLFDGVYPYGEETDIEKFLVSILHPLEDEFYLACGGGKLGTDGIDTQTILIQDWNKHLPASAIFPDMPKMLDRGLTSPFQFFVLETYAAEIGAGCRRVPWLEESIRQEVTGFENVIHDFRKLPRTTVLDPANFSQTARLIDRCVECLNSIPHLYELESGPAGKALSDLTMQLGLETLRLADLIQTQMGPLSPTLSTTVSTTDIDVNSDPDSNIVNQSSRNSVGINNNVEVRVIDNRAAARELVSSLASQDTHRALGDSFFEDHEIRQKVHRALEDYCDDLRRTRLEGLAFWERAQSSLYEKAEVMIREELDFVLEQLVPRYIGIIDEPGSTQILERPVSEAQVKFEGKIPGGDQFSSAVSQEVGLSSNAEVRTSSTSKPSREGPTACRGESTTDPKERESTIPLFILEEFLLGSKAFGRLSLKFRRLLGQDTMLIIQDEVSRALPLTMQGFYDVRLHIQWDLAQYISEELGGSTDIGRVFTLTGGSQQAYASACRDYLQFLWANSKYDICNHIRQYLEHQVYEHPDCTLTIDRTRGNSASVTITVIGTKEIIIKIAQQLAWLAAALRLSHTGPSLSEIDFIATRGTEFFIEVKDLTKAKYGEGTCWHQLVGNAAIASGFPIPMRAGQVGLELPLVMLISLSRVSFSLCMNGKFAFCGLSSLLYPTRQYAEDASDETRKSIQWHFEGSRNPHTYFDSAEFLAKSKPDWSLGVEESSLAASRHFIGYCRSAAIHLATLDCDFMKIQHSALPEASSTAGVKIKSLSAGTSGLGIFGGSANGDIIYPKSIAKLITLDDYDDILETTASMSVIVWDCQVQCAFLVPAQAVLLHMAHVWIKRNGLTSVIGYGEIGDSYINSVGKVLKDDYKTPLRISRENDKDFELRHLIKRFWNDIQGCMIARSQMMQDNLGVIGQRSGSIAGWELMDFIKRPPVSFVMKQDNGGASNCGWETLAAEKNTPVMVCQSAGDIIRPLAANSLCCDWKLPPKHKRYLIASLTCLDFMAQDYGGFQTCTRLTPLQSNKITVGGGGIGYPNRGFEEDEVESSRLKEVGFLKSYACALVWKL